MKSTHANTEYAVGKYRAENVQQLLSIPISLLIHTCWISDLYLGPARSAMVVTAFIDFNAISSHTRELTLRSLKAIQTIMNDIQT